MTSDDFENLRQQLTGKTITDLGATYNDDRDEPVQFGTLEIKFDDGSRLDLDTTTRWCPGDCSVYITAEVIKP